MAATIPYSGRRRRPGLIIGGGMVLLLLLAAVAYVYLRPVAEQARRAERGLMGLAYLTHIRDLIEPLQEYRGLMTMQAHIQPALPPSGLEERQLAAVDDACAALLDFNDEQRDPLGLDDEITALHQEWHQLRAVRDYSGPEEVFTTFTSHIGRVLALHRLTISSSGLALDPVAGTNNLVQIIDLMLEFVLEPTGQIRALYSSFLVNPANGGEMREGILGRATLLDTIITRIEHHTVMALKARPDLAPELERLPASLHLSADQIRGLLAQYSPAGRAAPADAQRFFTAATEIITDGYRLHDSALAAIVDGLNERLAEARSTFRNAIPLFLIIGLGTLALVGWGLAGWRQQEHNAEEIRRQSRFQLLVADISARFLQAGSETIDQAINETLRATGEFFAVDHASLFRISSDDASNHGGQEPVPHEQLPDNGRISKTHEWSAPGSGSLSATLPGISSGFPWWQKQVIELIRQGKLLRIADSEQLPAEAAAEREFLRTAKVRSLNCVPVRTNKKVAGFLCLDSGQARKWDDDRDVHLLAVIANLLSAALERDALERELTRNAITDGLTGLYNRRHFFTHLTTQTKEFRRTRMTFALVIFDIDHFKRLNDTYGHLAGDCVLRGFAALLKESFRAFDIVARYGGEEFIAMLINSDRKAAAATAQRVLDQTRLHHFECEGESLRITVSGGVVEVTEIAEGELTPESLVAEADQRLYRAKEQGRDRIIW